MTQPTSTVDPIFAAINAKKKATRAFMRAARTADKFPPGVQDTPAYIAAQERLETAKAEHRRAQVVFCRTVPTSGTGVAAAARYAASLFKDGIFDDWQVMSLLQSIGRTCAGARI